MGHIRHHTIIVTSWNEQHITKAHASACSVFEWVSPMSPEILNGYRSFFIPPDGSKEGWSESEQGDKRREEFKKSLAGLYVDWVELYFGGDDPEARIVDESGIDDSD